MTQAQGTPEGIAAWFGERLPREWVAAAPTVTVDREEIVVVLALPASDDDHATPEPGAPASESQQHSEAVAGRVARFREDTREQRIGIAREAESRYRRKVAWGVRAAGDSYVFTSLAVPAMTRLRQPERMVLDTLVDAGVARSRAHALAWCVKLVGQNSASWLGELREAMAHVERVRKTGPAAGTDQAGEADQAADQPEA